MRGDVLGRKVLWKRAADERKGALDELAGVGDGDGRLAGDDFRRREGFHNGLLRQGPSPEQSVELLGGGITLGFQGKDDGGKRRRRKRRDGVVVCAAEDGNLAGNVDAFVPKNGEDLGTSRIVGRKESAGPGKGEKPF